MLHSTRARRGAVVIGITTGMALAAGPAVAATSSAASTAPTAPRCATAQLAGQMGGDRMVGTAGRDFAIMQIINRSHTTCFVSGYPRVRIYDRQGKQISGTVHDRSRPAPTRVVLAPRAIAEFDVHDRYTDDPACQGDIHESMEIDLPPRRYRPGARLLVFTLRAVGHGAVSQPQPPVGL